MNRKEKIINDVLVTMRVHLTAQTMTLLSQALSKALLGLEVVEEETNLATLDQTNQYIIELFLARKAQKLSEKTTEQYLNAIRLLGAFLNKPITGATQIDIECFLQQYKIHGNKGAGNSNTTVNNMIRFLSAFYTWMRKVRLIQESPVENIEKYREIEKPIEHLNPEEWERLKSGCKNRRDRALLEFFRCTAMRDGEVPIVKVNDINWHDGKIVILGHKTGKYRTVCVDSVAKTYLLEYLEWRGISQSSSEYLFTHNKGDKTKMLMQTGIYIAIKEIAKRSGIQKNVYPHLLRKTTATNIVKRGGTTEEAGEYLGHAERNTAGRYYAYKDDTRITEIFRNLVAAI